MIKKIELNNFQAHKHTVLDLIDGINVITGQSDQGKSSIIRSLYWVFKNRPSGNEFMNWDSDSCSVKITTKNDDVIKRTRNKSKNQYHINNQKFDAVRTDVPNEIKEVLYLTDTNIQLQDDPHFLISLSASEAAKTLNEVVGIDIIDFSLQYINKIVRKHYNEGLYIQGELKEEENKLQKYKNLHTAQRKYKRLQKLYSRKETKDNKINSIDYFVEKLSDLEHIEKEKETIQTLDTNINTLGKQLTEIQKIVSNTQKLQKIIQQAEELNEIIQQEDKIKKAETNLNKLSSLYTQLNKINSKNPKILYDKINTQQFGILKLKNDVEKTENDFKKLKEELKICPLCEGTLST